MRFTEKLYMFLIILVLLEVTFWKYKSKNKSRVAPIGPPKPIRFAAMIPAHNEEACIGETVRSIPLDPDHVYVICNGCTDNTVEEVRKCGVEPVVVPCTGKEESQTYAINELKLFSKEKYTHVAFFDADGVVDSKFFERAKEKLEQNPDADIVCGRPKSLPFNWLTAHRAVQYWTFHAVHKTAQERVRAILVVPGCAGVYSTESLEKIVWSPDTRIGDMDATIQAHLLGMKIVFEPRAMVYTQDPNNLRDYTHQLYKRWNRGFWMNMRKHGILWKRLGWPLSALHWDCRMLVFLQFAPLLFLLAVWKFHLHYFFWGAMAGYCGWIILETLGCAFFERRWDILKYTPIFPFLRILDTVLFIASMPSILVRREKSGQWGSPKRYPRS